MQVMVDQEVCISSGNCAAIAPDIFELKDGKSQAKVGQVPPNLEDKRRKRSVKPDSL